MMPISKTPGRIVLAGVTATILTVTSLAPASAAAISSPFCANLSANSAKVATRLTELRTKAFAAADARDQAVSSRQAAWDQEIAAARANGDTKRAAAFDAMESKAAEGNQRGAVQEYERTINAAVSTRRQLNDDARSTYRDSMSKLITQSRTDLTTDIKAYEQKLTAAKTAAEASCNATPAQGATIRATLTQALKTARQTYKNDRQDRTPSKYAVSQLLQAHNDAMKANDKAYHQTATDARQKLRDAYNNQSI
jgi:hypothetical protein